MIKPQLYLGIIGVLLAAGCAVSSVDIVEEDESRLSTPLEESFTIQEGLPPREQAAMELTRRGWEHLKKGQPNEAIRLLEKALNLNPTGGQTCYYLSEAWLMSGDSNQAENFNRLAELYLSDDTHWVHRIIRQRDRIAELDKLLKQMAE